MAKIRLLFCTSDDLVLVGLGTRPPWPFGNHHKTKLKQCA